MSDFTESIDPRGYYQKAIYDLLNSLLTNFNAVLTKLDADGGVADVNYNSLYAISDPSWGSTYGKKVTARGMGLGIRADVPGGKQ